MDGRINRLIYNIVTVDINIKKSLWTDIWGPLTLDPAGMMKMTQVQMVVRKLGEIFLGRLFLVMKSERADSSRRLYPRLWYVDFIDSKSPD